MFADHQRSPASLGLTRRQLIITGAAGLGSLAITRPALADQTAEAYMHAVLTEANVFLGGSEQERMDGIARLVDKYVDMRRVSRFTLGQYVRKMSDAQRTVYEPLFKDYATLVYQKSLKNYSGQRLAVSNSIDRSERDIIVNSKIIDAKPGDQFANITVHWRIYRSKDGAMSVVDAGADGVWLAIEQRSQFTSIIANNGGGVTGIDALIAELQNQVG